MYHPFPTPPTPGTARDHYSFPPAHIPHLHHPVHPIHHPPPPPVRQSSSNSQSASSSRRGSHAQGQYSDSESDGEDDKVERDKLEIRREKNRVKQRNLRLRRANHIADLERDVSTLKSESSSLSNALSLAHAREASLQGWIHDLESVLFRNGLAADVEGMRRVWAERGAGSAGAVPGVGPGAGSRRGSLYPPAVGTGVNGDPLSTLARAASQQTPTYPHPHRHPHPHSHSQHSQHSHHAHHPHGGHPTMQMPDRPTLPRPGSFSKPYDNPYPTPDVVWPPSREPDMSLGAGSSLSAGSANAPAPGEGGKRKRGNDWEPYGLAGPGAMPPSASSSASAQNPNQPRSASFSHHSSQGQPGQQAMAGSGMSRRSDPSLNTLPPIHALPDANAPGGSPTSTGSAAAAAGSFFPPGASASHSTGAPSDERGTQGQGEGKVSPRLIRISDLVSPSHAGETFWGHGEIKRESIGLSPKQIPTDPLRLPPFRLQGSTSSTASTASSAPGGHGGHELPTPLSEMRA
ncbi:hypothetical protein L198_02493 [Cryptococcus wingfieldii CBS 7118]|uniref:BZIP domain-containing protein n=1 Tax=Cryptococcus wingfieldii CBS 7118 TaxID=1295528 RepID=A0A1E3JUN2_9TREE|nr:hypothetical protein L198_02493 [Cryptococcus wingfieldii CBS 7118]ODO03642.1 hypothetical protein L198_02493 [Cryptococcus wingfieldii CBS 7118]